MGRFEEGRNKGQRAEGKRQKAVEDKRRVEMEKKN